MNLGQTLPVEERSHTWSRWRGRLGIFSDDFYPSIGGMGRYVYDLTLRLPQDRTWVFSSTEAPTENYSRICPPLHRWLRNISFSFWLHRNLTACIEKHKLAAINIQCGPGGLFLLKNPRVPVIATCHHTWWQQSSYVPGQRWKKLFIPFEKRTYELANKIICDAVDIKEVLINHYDIRPEKITVIPIGIDSKSFYPNPEIETIPKSVLFIGRLDKRKGLHFLIGAMPRLVQKVPGVKLYIGGRGRLEAELRRYVDEHSLSENVEFLGFVPDEQLNDWYNRVSCVVVPSMFEGFGLTVVEAMAAGTPVVATNVDAVRNLVDHGVDGFLVNYNDVESLCDRLGDVLLDDELRKMLGSRGLEKIKAFYTWESYMASFEQELRQLDV